MTLQPNTTLQQGRYRIIDVLGQGGFGITYLAEQVMAERKVCIKEFFPKAFYNRDNSNNITLGSQGSAEQMERYKEKFYKEAKTIAKFDHPNIIHIFDVFEENCTCYYVMDYIDGESLQDHITRQGPMDEAQALTYIHEVGAALTHIHNQSVNHLDIKPSNIMIRHSDGRAILIDFGVSKHYDNEGSQTSTTPVGLSHGFAPIEQYREGGVSNFSPESDIYSLAATLYAILTAKTPPIASEVAEDGLPALPNHISASTCKAIECAMQMRRKDRPHSADEFLALLDKEVVARVYHNENDNRIATPSINESTVISQMEMSNGTPSHSEQTLFSTAEGSNNTSSQAQTQRKTPYSATNGNATQKRSSNNNTITTVIVIVAVLGVIFLIVSIAWFNSVGDSYMELADMMEYSDTYYY